MRLLNKFLIQSGIIGNRRLQNTEFPAPVLKTCGRHFLNAMGEIIASGLFRSYYLD